MLTQSHGRIISFWMILAASCSAEKPSQNDADMLIIGVENEIKSLDLRFATDANAVHVDRLITQGLVRVNKSLEIEPDLASRFEWRNSKELRFTVPPGAQFHNGQPVTLRDVLASFEQAAGPNSRIRSVFRDVSEMTTEGHDFILRFREPRPSFLLSEVPSLRIFPAGSELDPSFSQHPIGSGPYRFIRRKGRDLVFERFDQHRSYTATLPKPNYKRLIVRSLEDPVTRVLSLRGGEVDILFNALGPRRSLSLSRKHAHLYHSPGASFQYLGLNQSLPKLQDLRVRMALALATPRDHIIEHKLKGMAQAATSVLPPTNPFHNASLQPFPFDPSKARELLREAKAEKISLTIRSSVDREMLSIIEVIAQSWRDELGLDVKIHATEFAHFFSDVQKGAFEIFSLRWTAVADPDLLFKLFHSQELPPGRNRVAFKNQTVDRLLEQGRQIVDPEARKSVYLEAQKIIFTELPYIPLWYPKNLVLTQTNISELRLDPMGSWLEALGSVKVATP